MVMVRINRLEQEVQHQRLHVCEGHQKIAVEVAKIKNAWFFETTLRAVSINELIRINLGLNILRSCFLHWSPATDGSLTLSLCSRFTDCLMSHLC